MDGLNIKNEGTSLKDMDFSNEFDKYICDLEDRRNKIADLLN